MDEKISKLFLPIVDKLYNTEPAGEPFRKPVDPIKYACYDYYIFVEHPIDLSTIRQKLINHQYGGDAWRFIADVELMLANAFAFNKKGTTVYEFTNRLNKTWSSEITSIMQRLNYCCGNTYKFGPQLLFCHGTTPDKYCQIAIGAKYKCYQDSYSFCIPCFNRIRTEYISLETLTCETSRMNLPTQPVKKSDFIDCANDRWQYEAFIKCTQCSRRLHQICELYPAHDDDIKQCPQHEQIEKEQKQKCFVPPEFEQFAKPGNKLQLPPPPPPTLPPGDSQSSIDAELLAFARDVDDSNSQSVPGSPNPDENVNNHYDCAKDNRPEDGQIQSGDIHRTTSISRSSSTYTTSTSSPSNKNSVDDIAARLSINKMSAENQADNEKQQLAVATLKRDKFVCNHCYRKERLGFNLRPRKYSARRLPHTRMSRYIETKVNEFIRENSPTAGEMTVRVLTAYRDKFEVKNEMKSFLRQSRAKNNTAHPNLDQYPDNFEFTTRAIFAWQEIDGVDVCVFGMHVQEYGEDCPEPNKQVVYLSYLDSVHFFRPKQFRTAVYHEILLSYFKYVKKLGFRRVFIWVCPSRKGDDYIFYRHPTEQKMPTLKRLSDWYVHLLDKGVADGIVERHHNIYEYAMTENWSSILSMPYLSGDYWPGEFERLLNLMIESQKKYEEKITYCKQEIEEPELVEKEEPDGSEYLHNDPSLEQHNVLSLSNLYQKASSGTQRSGCSGKMINLKKSSSIGLKTPTRNASVMGDQEGPDWFSVDQDDSKFFEPFTPNSTRSDDQPLDLSKSTSAASPESYYDDDQSDATWKEPCSRKRRRKSSSTMGYTKKRSRGAQGRGRPPSNAALDASVKSQKSFRLKCGLRSCGDAIDGLMSPEEEMLKNLERSLKRQREGFIVVRLSECDCSPHFESLRRKEESVFTCDLMRGREPFLQLARLKNYEFCTLRRAKFSSLAMVKHLGEFFKLEPICNECFSFDSSKRHYTCKHCEDYYLCTSCYENTHHEHAMTLLPPSMLPDIDEFLQQCPPASATNSLSSASSTISNTFNDTSPEIQVQQSTTLSANNPELIIDNNIPLNRQTSNGFGATISMPLGCKRQRNWPPSLESRTEDEENANIDLFTSNNKLSLSHRASPPPSHSSNRARNNHFELDQALIEGLERRISITHAIDFDDMKGESKKLLSHYFACPIKDTCLRCKFVVLSCSYMRALMRSSQMQMAIDCHPNDMLISSNGSGNNNNNSGLASDGINLTTNRRFG
uniref:histone acetyltransferase n=1 Tax=Aceria tosichella TaxID=561515 RepID=A0A6G1SFB8_9ACAR